MTSEVRTKPRPQPRRTALLEAAVDIVGERGLAGATHKAVTERADVPLATASYYFASIADLLREALEGFVTERMESAPTADLLAGEGTASPETIRSWFAQEITALPRPQALAYYEVILSAARMPELEKPVAEMLEHFQAWGQSGLEAAGATDPAEAARPFLALALGFGLLRLVQPSDTDAADFDQAMGALFTAYTP